MSDNKTEVKNSISSIYSALLNKRKKEKEEREECKRQEKEARKLEKENNKEENDAPLTKKEKRKRLLDSWKEVLVGLTGEDLEYEKPKGKRKKYRKWITDDDTGLLNEKPKKKKKRNYNKEFAPELSMLKNIVTDQNRFTADLLKRYQHAAGPNTKDGMPLNKTLVELASVINASRANSLSTLKEIGNIKKTISDLYMKQFKLDLDSGKLGNQDTDDLGLLGSSLASSVFSSPSTIIQDSVAEPVIPGTIPLRNTAVQNSPQQQEEQKMQFPTFDPAGWNAENVDIGATKFESIPHKVVVEYNEAEQKARYKAVREDNGEELIGCPVPTGQIKSMDLKTKMAKDDFDQIYPIEMIG